MIFVDHQWRGYDKLDKYPSELSGGEQRVSIARLAKARDSFLDEPTGSPDTENRAQDFRLYLEIKGEAIFTPHHGDAQPNIGDM